MVLGRLLNLQLLMQSRCASNDNRCCLRAIDFGLVGNKTDCQLRLQMTRNHTGMPDSCTTIFSSQTAPLPRMTSLIDLCAFAKEHQEPSQCTVLRASAGLEP